MEQATRKFSNLWWITVTVAVLMALLFAVETPLVAFAESESKDKYIKETVMITATGIDDANAKVKKLNDNSGKTYYLFGKPIYSHDGLETYIAYTTTNNVKNSVKAIKSMYMKGGWSYEEYDKYLDQLADKTNFLAKDLYYAICEYAAHLKAGKKNATYAKGILEFLYEDDSNLNLSDFFVSLASKGDYELVKDQMVTFMMQANKDILATVESALMIACKDSYVGFDADKGEEATDTSFLTGMQRTQFLESVNGYKGNAKYAYLDVYVQDLLVSLPQVQNDIRFYMNSNHMFSEEADEMAMAIMEAVAENESEDSEDDSEEFEEQLIDEIKSEGSEEEKQTMEDLDSVDAYLNSLSLDEQNSYNNGKMYYDALRGCEYTGYNNQYSCLLGLFMLHEGTTEKISTQYSNDDFYPFLIQLSEGQRALLKVGLPQLISTTVMPVDAMDGVFDNMLDTINEAAETEEEKIKKGEMVSVYKDVDRSLYVKDSGIAMTSKAIEAAKSKPLAHVTSDNDKVSLVCGILGVAAGAVGTVSILTVLGMGRKVQLAATPAFSSATKNIVFSGVQKQIYSKMANYGYSRFSLLGQDATAYTTTAFLTNEPVYANITLANGYVISAKSGTKQFTASFMDCCGAYLSTGFGIVLNWINAVSLAVMVISLLIELVYPLIKPENDEPYIDIPRVMCSYEEVYGQTKIEGMDPVEDYIYYYGMKNPFLSEDDNKRANDRRGGDGKDTTDILKHGIGDVANWTLKGLSRQWVAIYTSTDSKAGKPILANSLTVLNDINDFSKDKELISVKKFHENSPFDFNGAYAATKNKDLTPVYLGYKFDNNAGTTTTQTASVFSSITLLGGIAAGLILGGGIGTLVTYGIIRKRKKSSVTA